MKFEINEIKENIFTLERRRKKVRTIESETTCRQARKKNRVGQIRLQVKVVIVYDKLHDDTIIWPVRKIRSLVKLTRAERIGDLQG